MSLWTLYTTTYIVGSDVRGFVANRRRGPLVKLRQGVEAQSNQRTSHPLTRPTPPQLHAAHLSIYVVLQTPKSIAPLTPAG